MKVPQQDPEGNSCGFFAAENIRLICLNHKECSTNQSMIHFFSNLSCSQDDMDKKRKRNSDVYERQEFYVLLLLFSFIYNYIYISMYLIPFVVCYYTDLKLAKKIKVQRFLNHC